MIFHIKLTSLISCTSQLYVALVASVANNPNIPMHDAGSSLASQYVYRALGDSWRLGIQQLCAGNTVCLLTFPQGVDGHSTRSQVPT